MSRAGIRLVLASASPARKQTLLRAGVVPEVIVSGVDESCLAAASPAETAQLLANAKAEAVRALAGDGTLVLGCDSLLEFEGESLGKPGTVAAAIRRWHQLRGRSGVLHTGHCLIDSTTGRSAAQTVSTVVHFADVSDAEIELYCRSGEPAEVAGAFTIDGLGGWFIDRIEGDPHNVVGLSLPLLRRMLHQLDVSLDDIGYPTA